MRSQIWGLMALALTFAGEAQAQKEKAKVLEIKLSTKGNDVAFDRKAVEVKASGPIAIKFVNEATKDSEIIHNVAILKPGTMDKVIKFAQENAYDIEKIKKLPEVIVISKAVSPGDTGIVEFTPEKPGFYPYVCLMPGHGDILGMWGTLHVRK